VGAAGGSGVHSALARAAGRGALGPSPRPLAGVHSASYLSIDEGESVDSYLALSSRRRTGARPS
jgi:hypothetical protein